MGNRTEHDEFDFMDWLDSAVKESPEALSAEKEETLKIRLADALKAARLASGMPQSLVSEASGLKQSMVSRLEKANHNPTLESIIRYLEAIGADLVITIILGKSTFAATEASERSILLSEDVLEKAKERGLELNEYVLSCIEASNAINSVKQSLQEVVRAEIGRQFQDMRNWIEDRPNKPTSGQSMKDYYTSSRNTGLMDPDNLIYPAAA